MNWWRRFQAVEVVVGDWSSSLRLLFLTLGLLLLFTAVLMLVVFEGWWRAIPLSLFFVAGLDLASALYPKWWQEESVE